MQRLKLHGVLDGQLAAMLNLLAKKPKTKRGAIKAQPWHKTPKPN
jgi:hypothetical protein